MSPANHVEYSEGTPMPSGAILDIHNRIFKQNSSKRAI